MTSRSTSPSLFPTLAPGLIGSTDIRYLGVAYTDIRAALTLDRTSSDDVTAVAGLPSGDRLSIKQHLFWKSRFSAVGHLASMFR
ncbi:MAG: hypothetical protein ACKO3G_15960 [Planctomycetaceae bacterium]